MAWVPVSAWLAALLIAIVLLGFCGYEIFWKLRRLRADLARLGTVADQLADLQDRLADSQDRIAAAGRR